MQILNITGYKFILLSELFELQKNILDECASLALKGTILLGSEGINISLAGTEPNINIFKAYIKQDPRLADITYRESFSTTQPFQTLKIKLKNGIITFRQAGFNSPAEIRAPSIAPEIFKQWLDEKRDMTLLDTRNGYEVRFGTFKGAVNLHLENFGEFPEAAEVIERDKPIVMFCTGGIRCEKAALYMLSQGFSDVYQLDGGILNYFAKVGGAHYLDECFVFDKRISVDTNLHSTGTIQCTVCQGPVTLEHQHSAAYVPGISCPACII